MLHLRPALSNKKHTRGQVPGHLQPADCLLYIKQRAPVLTVTVTAVHIGPRYTMTNPFNSLQLQTQ